jgi:hypothetical protein
MIPKGVILYPQRAEDWAQLRCVDRWRFIVADGVRAAISTALAMIVFGLSVVAYWANRDGQTLDFHWFKIAGQPGANTFPIYRHALATLPVGFLFSLVFWLFAGAKCWWLNERMHREALAKQSSTPLLEETDVMPLAALAGVGMRVGECVFLVFFIYLPVANNWPQIRPPQIWEETLYAAGFVGAGLVWGISFAAWLVNLAKGLLAFVRRPFQRDVDAVHEPNPRTLTHPNLGPLEPSGMEYATPSLKRYRTCVYVGTSLLLCGFILSSPLGPFLGLPILDWVVRVGVGFLLAGVGFAAHGSYTELQKLSQAQAGQEPSSCGAESMPVTTERVVVGPPRPFWLILLTAGVLFVGFSKVLGLW